MHSGTSSFTLKEMGFSRAFSLKLGLICLLLAGGLSAHAGPYVEAGTSLGTIKSGDDFFGSHGASSTGFGFVGSLSLYFTALPHLGVAHFDFGLQNRFSTASTSNGLQLAMLTPHLSARYEFYRFFAGGGYAPIVYRGTDGLSSMVANSGVSAYFFEGGIIWRVVPEFQIVAAGGLERGSIGPTNMEYGLRFRFPLNPKDDVTIKGVQWDGFRYPFGVMRD